MIVNGAGGPIMVQDTFTSQYQTSIDDLFLAKRLVNTVGARQADVFPSSFSQGGRTVYSTNGAQRIDPSELRSAGEQYPGTTPPNNVDLLAKDLAGILAYAMNEQKLAFESFARQVASFQAQEFATFRSILSDFGRHLSTIPASSPVGGNYFPPDSGFIPPEYRNRSSPAGSFPPTVTSIIPSEYEQPVSMDPRKGSKVSQMRPPGEDNSASAQQTPRQSPLDVSSASAPQGPRVSYGAIEVSDFQVGEADFAPRRTRETIVNAKEITEANWSWATGDFVKDEEKKSNVSKLPTDPAFDAIKVEMADNMASFFLHDDDVEQHPYRVEDFYKTTGCAQGLAKSRAFGQFSELLVCANAVWIGVDQDWNKAPTLFEAHIFFIVMSLVFVFFFTFELVVRFAAFANKRDSMKDGWFKFDLFLVTTMLLDVAISAFTMMSGGGTKTVIPTQPLRLLRLLKLLRMALLMRIFPELGMLLKGLVRSLRAMISTFVLIVLMVYVWAIMLHTLLHEEDKMNKRFSDLLQRDFKTVPHCMWTLVLDGTLMLDGAGPIATDMVLHPSSLNQLIGGCLFVSFAVLTAIMVLQLLIGVLCDVVTRVNDENRDAVSIAAVKQNLLREMKELAGTDNKLSRQSLLDLITNPSHRATMNFLGINQLFLIQMVEMMFPHHNVRVSIKECLRLVLLCRSDNNANVEALAGGFCFLEKQIGLMHEDLRKQARRYAYQPGPTQGCIDSASSTFNPSAVPSQEV